MSNKRYIVTGGGGFVGRSLCAQLKRAGHSVVSIARGSYPALEKAGIETRRIDLSRDAAALSQLFEGADAVFHVAAKVDMWGEEEDFFRANVVATRNVIAACRESGVRKLIFTSSPSVIADGTDLNGIDESYPYPASHSAYYPATKAQAEREMLAANSPELYTIALRPHLIWGPGDTNLIPTILKRARTGKLVKIGGGQNIVDITYIEDCVSAHICALNALDTNPAARGQAYFISQGEPVKMWEWIDQVLQYNGLPPVSRNISKSTAMLLARVMEGGARLLPGHLEPPLTRFLVSEMSTNHYFNIAKARRDLGFEPRFSVQEGLQATFQKVEKP